MALEDIKKDLGGRSTDGRPEKISAPVPKEGPAGPPREGFLRSEIRQYLSKPNLELQGKTGLPSDRRGGLEGKWFGSESGQFGSRIQPEEIDRRISQLRDEKSFNERQGKWETAKQLKKDIEGLETMKNDLLKK